MAAVVWTLNDECSVKMCGMLLSLCYLEGNIKSSSISQQSEYIIIIIWSFILCGIVRDCHNDELCELEM